MRSFVPTAACVLALAGVSPLTGAEPDRQDLARKAQQVLTTHCYRCHGKGGANEGGFNYALDRRRLLERRKVVPGNPAKSRLYRRLANEDMPPPDEKPRPSAADIALLKRWIEAGAPDFNPPSARRTLITQADVWR